MNNATLLRIENRRPPSARIDEDDNLRNRVGRLIEEMAKHGDTVSASTDSHPWFLHLDSVSSADYARVRQRCDEVAATLQIELG